MKKFEKPEMRVIRFENSDILTTSGPQKMSSMFAGKGKDGGDVGGVSLGGVDGQNPEIFQ